MSGVNSPYWDIQQKLLELPQSHRVPVQVLLRVFDKTTTSYKYLYFLSLLDVLEATQFNQLTIPLDAILLEMLVNAWYPHTYFKLSFGVSDKIAEKLSEIDADSNINISNKSVFYKKAVRDFFSNKLGTCESLLKYVPYRLLTPFFENECRGVPDAYKNKSIICSAQAGFSIVKPFYMFSDDGKSLIMQPDWMLYFYENAQLIRTFISWKWLDYMQKRNPSVPNLQLKLFTPLFRASLSRQTAFWRAVLHKQELRCIFSGSVLSEKDLSLDHFLPWSFVAHDQLWNLIPVSRRINSAKSNNLPSLDRYLQKFMDLQFTGLTCYRSIANKSSWNTVIEPYVADLRLSPENLLNKARFQQSLRSTIEPLATLAATQGFSAGWEYGGG